MDLINTIGTKLRAPPSIRQPDNKTASQPDKAAVPIGRWGVIDSKLLNEEILIVFDKKDLRDARKEHPDKVAYFEPEIEELYQKRNNPDFREGLIKIHMAKRKFNGWIVPSSGKILVEFS